MNKLQNTLTKMNSLDIKSNKLLLSHTILHEEFFLNLDHFITNTIFRSKKNLMHLSELTCKYGVNIDDIRFDCLERCVSKLDLILTIDLECQIPYIYKICNNIIVDYFRKTVQYVLTTVSLNQVLLHNNDSDSLRHVKTIVSFRKLQHGKFAHRDIISVKCFIRPLLHQLICLCQAFHS